MQRDTHLRLGEIHNDPEALGRSIDDIIQTALVQVSEEEPLKLRFITPSVPLEEWLEDERRVDYELTLPEAHESGMEYITVSYCWQHEQCTDGLPPTPNYQLRDRSKDEGAPRPIRCPPLVFHRAIMYARHRKCPYVWIDQECIDQGNSVDVEKHLQIMHRVYEESRWTVAVLSHTLQRDQGMTLKASFVEIGFPGIKAPIRILQQIAEDRWFTRTWILQEKYCAFRMQLLVPVEGTLVALKDDRTPILGFDLLLDMLALQEWAHLTINESPSRSLDLCFKYGDIMESKEMHQLATIFAPRRRRAVQQDRVRGNRMNYFQRLFRQTEVCDNLLVADRVSILGIICDLPLRLLSNRLDDEKYSYSTCVLALFLANFFPEQTQLREFLDKYGKSLLRLRVDMILRLHFEMFRLRKIWLKPPSTTCTSVAQV